MNQIALKVNEKGLVNGLRNAFTTKTTLMKEIMQNGDRAGATEIRIWIEAEGQNRLKVVIVDNGCGIDDMGILLSVAESGWDEQIMVERLPYGMGFLSALYATSAIEVESRGFRVSFESKEALGFKPVLVEQHPESAQMPGTRLVLHGLMLKESDANGAVRKFATGFPVPIFLNDEEVGRDHALDAAGRSFVKTDVGLVSIPGLEKGNARGPVKYYLQGFQVYSSWNYGHADSCVVVHLDPAKFVARMPDRDVLINEADRINEVDRVIRTMWREMLATKKTEMPAAEFIEQFWDAIQLHGRDLLNDIPLLPRQSVEGFTSLPFQAPDGESYSDHPDVHVAMDDVISGKVVLVDLDDMTDEGGIAAWNYAWARNALVINQNALDRDHWARKFVRDINSERTQVTVHGQYGEGQVSGSYIWGIDVILCESLDILVRDDDDMWNDSVSIDSEIVFDGSRFLVPRNAQATGWAVQQASNYMDGDDRYQESDMESDWNDLQRKIHEMRGLPPAEVLTGLLEQRNVSLRDYPSLHEKSFVLEVDASGGISIAEHVTQQ